MRSSSKRTRAVVPALVLAMAAGCSSSEPASPGSGPATRGTGSPDVTRSATTTPEPSPIGTIVVFELGCTVDGIGGRLDAGSIALTIVNETDGPVVADMSRILDGGTYEDLEAHIAKEIRLAEAGKPGLGHPSYAPPSFNLFLDAGETDVLSGDIRAGTYAIGCGRWYDEVGEVRPSGVAGPYRVE